ncbi:MAG: galactose-1-phosphate uridylyltransferase [Micrococcaceae bacterium]
MNITKAKLSDGRDIFFYDDESGKNREITDTRKNIGRPTTGKMRYDALRDEWISFASHRQTRTLLPKSSECPLCPTTSEFETEIPTSDYDVVVFENRFPSFQSTEANECSSHDIIRPAFGRCEVVAYNSEHEGSLAELPLNRIENIINVWADRTKNLSKIDGIEQVFVFENRGQAIGVTLDHPHGQIYGYPYVTPTTKLMLETAKKALKNDGKHPVKSSLEREHEDETRIISKGKYFTSFVPFAARMPIEIHIVSHKQYATLGQLPQEEVKELAEIYKDALERVDALYSDNTAYISAWHQAPVNEDPELTWLHLQIISPRRDEDKLKFLAGSEAAMGAFIADVLPEETAERLRKAK